MKWITRSPVLFETDQGHIIRKASENVLNCFFEGRYIGSGRDRKEVMKILSIKQPEQQTCDEWLEDYCKEPMV